MAGQSLSYGCPTELNASEVDSRFWDSYTEDEFEIEWL